MSVILKGDVISNFGELLPSPYIRHIVVEDQSLTVTLSVFINLGQEQDIDTMLESLHGSINFYLHYTVDPARQDKIIEGRMNPFQYYTMDGFTSHPYDMGDGFIQLSGIFDSTTDEEGNVNYTNLVDDNLYDEKGNLIWEFRVENSEIVLGENVDPDAWSGVAGLWINSAYYGEENGLASVLNDETYEYGVTPRGLYVNAFSSLIDASVEDEVQENVSNPTLLNVKTSAVSYQTVFDGIIQSTPWNFITSEDSWPIDATLKTNIQTEMVDNEGAIYDKTPLQSIQSPYYKIDNVTHQEIVDYFQELVDEFQAQASKDRTLRKMVDNISYILTTSGQKANLLPQLNKLRQLFPSKSSATLTGKLYSRFKKRIYTVNKRIEEGGSLKQLQVKNPKVVDGRTAETREYEVDWTNIDNSDISSNTAGGYIYNNWFITCELDEYSDIAANYGFFFFDYEKALRRASNLASMVDVSRLESLLGVKIPYGVFRIKEASISRALAWSGDGGTDIGEEDHIVTITSVMGDKYQAPYTSYCTIDSPDNDDLSAGGFALVYADASYLEAASSTTSGLSAGSTEGEVGFGALTPALVVRNFQPYQMSPIVEGNPDYRLLMFEFQDYYSAYWTGDYSASVTGWTEYTAGKYGRQVIIEDKTAFVMNVLISKYNVALEALEEYAALASEICSINERTGEFNTFFTNTLVEQFSGNEESAPWNLAPTLYAIHQELLFNIYEGDDQKLLDDVANMISLINPYNGSLENIQNLALLMRAFYEANYDWNTASSDSIAYKLGSLANPVTIPQEIFFTIPIGSADSSGAMWPARRTTKVGIPSFEGDCYWPYQPDDSTQEGMVDVGEGSSWNESFSSDPTSVFVQAGWESGGMSSGDYADYMNDTIYLRVLSSTDGVEFETTDYYYGGNEFATTGPVTDDTVGTTTYDGFYFDYTNRRAYVHQSIVEAHQNSEYGEYGAVCFLFKNATWETAEEAEVDVEDVGAATEVAGTVVEDSNVESELTIGEATNQEECEEAGGVWTICEDCIDMSALTEEEKELYPEMFATSVSDLLDEFALRKCNMWEAPDSPQVSCMESDRLDDCITVINYDESDELWDSYGAKMESQVVTLGGSVQDLGADGYRLFSDATDFTSEVRHMGVADEELGVVAGGEIVDTTDGTWSWDDVKELMYYDFNHSAFRCQGVAQYMIIGADEANPWYASPSVLCTELSRQGLFPLHLMKHDDLLGRKVREKIPSVYEGYRILAAPIVHQMKRSATITERVRLLVVPSIRYFAGDKTLIGAVLLGSALFASGLVGLLHKFNFKKSAYLLGRFIGRLGLTGHRWHKIEKEEDDEKILRCKRAK